MNHRVIKVGFKKSYEAAIIVGHSIYIIKRELSHHLYACLCFLNF